MPLYLVRWQDLSASIVRARDKTQLMDILDEIDDPSDCKITEYRGPLFVDLTLRAHYKVSHEVARVEDVGQCLDHPSFDFGNYMGDTGYDTLERLLKFAFPYYYEYLQKYRDKHGDETNPKPDAEDKKLCKAALRKELEEAVEPRLKWRVEQRLRLADAYGLLSEKGSEDRPDSPDEDYDSQE